MWSERVGETTSSSAYSSVTVTKITALKLLYFTSITPVTEVLMTLKFQTPLSYNNELFPLYFNVPSSVLVLDSVGYKTIRLDTRHPHYAMEASAGIQQLTFLVHFSLTKTDLSHKTFRTAHSIPQHSNRITLH